MYHQSQKNTQQLMPIIFKLYTKGLSFNCISYLTKYGMSPNLKSFKNYLNIISKSNITLLLSEIEVNHPIFWIDNYSKFYKHSKILNSGGTTNALWSAIGTITGFWNINKYDELFQLFPTISTTYYSLVQIQLNQIFSVFKLKIDTIYSEINSLWTIPLSVKKLDRHKYIFKPLDLSCENIASNEGLKNVVKNLAYSYFKQNKWNIIVCDSNPYWRLNKKYYQLPKPLSLRPIPIFGLWIPGKMLVECVWRSYLSYFIAPAYHYIYPNACILFKTRLSHSIELFIQLHLAYKSWKTENILPNIEINNKGFKQFKNTKIMFDFFLPLVCLNNVITYLI